jgi:hypothetical protein
MIDFPQNEKLELEKEKLAIGLEEAELDTKDFIASYPRLQKYFLLIIVVLIIPVYFIAKYSVGALYFNNFEKTAINVHSSVFTSLPIQIVDTKILPLGGNNYSAYVLVANPNKDLVAPDFKYVFNFFNFQGQQVSATISTEGHEFLLAGERKYIILPNVTLTDKPYSVKLVLSNPLWQKRLSIPNVVLSASLPAHADQQSPPGFIVDGTILNQSGFTLGQVKINAIVFDSFGRIIAVTQSVANTLAPKQQRAYHLYWPMFLQSVVGKIQITPETNILDPNNLQ